MYSNSKSWFNRFLQSYWNAFMGAKALKTITYRHWEGSVNSYFCIEQNAWNLNSIISIGCYNVNNWLKQPFVKETR